MQKQLAFGWTRAQLRLGCVILCACALHIALSSGYLALNGSGTPFAWSTASSIELDLDLGNLGSLTNADADTLVLNAADQWSSSQVSTCAITFTQGPDLASDQTGASHALYDNGVDSINAVAYDTDGTLTDAVLGAGANNVVVGTAGYVRTSGSTILEGRILLNGRFIDGAGSPSDVSQAIYTGAITHEIGHFLNLDHSQFNGTQRSDLTGHPAN